MHHARRRVLPRALNTAFEAVLLALAGVVIFAAVGPMAGWWHYEVIESGSMTPTLGIGGVAIVAPEPITSVKVGQVIAFHPPHMGNYVRIHRVIAITRRGDQVWVTTKGDANPTADPGPVRLEGKTAYSERAFVPYVGYAGVWLSRHSARTALTIALLVLMVGGGLWLIWGGGNDSLEDEQASEGTKRPSVARVPAPHGPRPVLTLSREASSRDAGAHVKAERAATASLAALSNIYTADPEGGEQLAAPVPGPPKHARSRR